MLIIWGKGEGINVLGELEEHDCPACENQAAMFQAVVNYTYRHIWYLFSWISNREYYAVCNNCGNSVPLDKAEAQRMFPRTASPLCAKCCRMATKRLINWF